MKRILGSLIVASCLLGAVRMASAQPKVVGSATELGTWDYATSAAVMYDDGLPPDATAGDGVFTATVAFTTTGPIAYKVNVDGVSWYGGAVGQNVAFTLAAAGDVTFYYDARDVSPDGWVPPQHAVSDSVTAASATWVAVGDFQSELGGVDWDPSSTTTVARDDGTRGDRVSGDGIYTYRFVAPAAMPAVQYKFAAQGATWTTKLGADGWAFEGQADAAEDGFAAQAGDVVSLELDARRGHMRVLVETPAKLLLTEIVSSYTEWEFVEIYNPNAFAVDLTDYYLADVATYYDLPAAAHAAITSGSYDFVVRFPAGAVIAAGEHQTVSLAGALCFETGCSVRAGLGVPPTYELNRGVNSYAATVADMLPAWTGSVSTAPGLTNTNEPVILFRWDQVSDLIDDVDYVFFGATTTNTPVNKTGLSIDGPDDDAVTTPFLADTADDVARHAPLYTNFTCRRDYAETGQTATGGNGVTGADETSENWSQTWRGCRSVTPGAASPVTLTVTPETAALQIGQTGQLTVAITDALGGAVAGLTPTYASDATGVATVDAAGLVTAAGAGSATVTASADGLSDSTAVTVSYRSIAVSCGATLLHLSGTTTCTATAYDASDQPVTTTFTWEAIGSSATVDPATGVVTADAATTGVTRIVARAAGDTVTNGWVDVSVEEPEVAGLTIALDSACPSTSCLPVAPPVIYTVAALGQLTFTVSGRDQFGDPIAVTGETWHSSNPMAAPDPVAGVLTALDTDGWATSVSASVGSVYSNAVMVQVEARAPATVAIGGEGDGTLEQLATRCLTAAVTDQFGVAMAAGFTLEWASDNTASVGVDADGCLTATTTLGTALVTVTVQGTSITDSTSVQVVAAVPVATTVTITPASASIQEGGTQTFTAQVFDQLGSEMTASATITWESDDALVATVSPTTNYQTVATAVGAGSATITATADGVASGTAALEVTVAPPVVDHVVVTPASASVAVGGTAQFTAAAYDAGDVLIPGVTFTWSTGDGAIAGVDQTGLATGLGVGGTTVIATADDTAVSGTANLEVTAVTPVIDAIVVTPATATIDVGATQQFLAVALDADSNPIGDVVFDWASSNDGIATVSMAGLATGVAGGSVTITASADGVEGTATLTVNTPPPVIDHITVTPASASILVGGTQSFSAAAYDAAGAVIGGVSFTWDSSNDGVATVSSAGLATGVTAGTVTITATAGGVDGTATLEVTEPPPVVDHVTVTPASATVQIGGTAQFAAAAYEADGTLIAGATIAWSSSSDAVATVSASGLATGVTAGTVTITATADGVDGTATLEVTEPPPVVDHVTVTPASATVQIGAAQQFTAAAYEADGTLIAGAAIAWSSSSDAVATVSSSGLATGVAAGTVTITATADGVSGTASLEVTEPPPVVDHVTVTPASASVEVGSTQQFTAIAYEADNTAIGGVTFAWASSNAATATVSSSGLATGVAAGTVTITATADGVAGTASLEVTLPPPVLDHITITPASAAAEAGGTQQFTAVAHEADGTVIGGVTFAWASDDEAVATVNAAGLATAVAEGTATISATADGVTGEASLTVTEAPPAIDRVEVTPSTGTVAPGGSLQLGATAYDADDNEVSGVTFTWASSDAGVATVSGSGLATGVAAGVAEITATAEGVSGGAVLTVSTPTFTLSGHVLDQDGEPIVAALVSVPGLPSVLTDAAGAYEVDGVPVGTHQVVASKGGYTPQTQSVTISEDATLDFTLTAEPGDGCAACRVGGRTERSSGGALGGALALGLLGLGLVRRRTGR